MSLRNIKQIKEAEEKAELLKKEAITQAKQIIASANEEASIILDEAKKRAETNRLNFLKNAESEGQKLYDDIIKEAQTECDNVLKKADVNMEEASSIILERIVKTSGDS